MSIYLLNGKLGIKIDMWKDFKKKVWKTRNEKKNSDIFTNNLWKMLDLIKNLKVLQFYYYVKKKNLKGKLVWNEMKRSEKKKF